MDQKKLQALVEKGWHDRAKAQGLKPKSMAYKKAELEFFAGAMNAINAMAPNADPTKLSEMVPPIWIVNGMSGLPVALTKPA